MRWYQRLIGRSCGNSESRACSNEDLSARPYVTRSSFLSNLEMQLFRQLTSAVGDRVCIFPKVRVADALAVADAAHHLDDAVAIDRKSVDFLLCEIDAISPAVAVSLLPRDNRIREHLIGKVEQAFFAAGIPVVFISPDDCSVEELRSQLLPLLVDHVADGSLPSGRRGSVPHASPMSQAGLSPQAVTSHPVGMA